MSRFNRRREYDEVKAVTLAELMEKGEIDQYFHLQDDQDEAYEKALETTKQAETEKTDEGTRD